MTKKQYWKSLKHNEGKIVSGYDGSEWQIGEWRTISPPERECEGLNCSEYIADAMGYVEMEVLAQVEIAGKVIKGDDKITSEKMRILHAYRWEKKDSVAMAVYAAELAIENFEKKYPNDKRPREAIGAAKAWIINPCKITESAAASASWSAARSAAWSAVRSAEESAAWSAAWSAAESASWSAAWSAEESAEESAAESAAESASWSAAESAAWSAAWSAARKKMKDRIQRWIVKHITELKEIK